MIYSLSDTIKCIRAEIFPNATNSVHLHHNKIRILLLFTHFPLANKSFRYRLDSHSARERKGKKRLAKNIPTNQFMAFNWIFDLVVRAKQRYGCLNMQINICRTRKSEEDALSSRARRLPSPVCGFVNIARLSGVDTTQNSVWELLTKEYLPRVKYNFSLELPYSNQLCRMCPLSCFIVRVDSLEGLHSVRFGRGIEIAAAITRLSSFDQQKHATEVQPAHGLTCETATRGSRTAHSNTFQSLIYCLVCLMK